jgi:hypothetical protein
MPREMLPAVPNTKLYFPWLLSSDATKASSLNQSIDENCKDALKAMQEF